MKSKKTPIASAIALMLMGAATGAYAQQADTSQPQPSDTTTSKTGKQPVAMESVVVTGIRASRQQSIAAKRNADSVVEVVTAEDIGKLPDKNVADAIQRVPGVNISSAAGGEGGFDENDRVSIRGTSPSLTQTLINGHSVATGDWFILDQFQTVGRSVSYSLLPSELVQKVTVQKSATADLVEGGVAGAVNIETRHPLALKKDFVAEGTLGAVYADLPDKTSPQFNALVGWKNEDHTFGFLLQAFSEERHVRRDGQEFLGYSRLPTAPGAAGTAGAVVAAHPDLAGVAYPTLIGSSLFEQDRKRQGGAFDAEWKASNDLTLDLNGFYSHLNATNYNRNFMAWPDKQLSTGNSPTSYTVSNGTLVAASFAPSANPAGVVDNIYRPDASAESEYIDLNGKFRATDSLSFKAAVGYTRGVGKTPSQPAYEGNINGTGMTYSMNGTSSPAVVTFPGGDPSNFAGTTTGWAWDETITTTDTESYGTIDADWMIESGMVESAKFGLRYSDHRRKVDFPIDGGCLSTCWSTLPTWNGQTYPGNFGNGLNPPAGFLTNVWQLDPAAVSAYAAANVSHGPDRHYWPGEMNVQEKDSAGYGMVNFAGDRWRGNVGVRLVNTNVQSLVNVSGGQNPLTDSAFGPYTPTLVEHNYFDVLPSANVKFDLNKDLVTRFAIAETMSRPDYSALGGSVALTDLTLTGVGGNPDLKPIKSTNYDATLEWYFQPKAIASIGLFYMDMSSYVTYSTHQAVYFNQLTQSNATYTITSPSNIAAKNHGVELSLASPIAWGLGAAANYTYANGHDEDGGELVGASKNTYNVEGYYEDERLSARLAYTYRSEFLVGLDRSFAEHMDAYGTLAMSVNYKLTNHFTVSFDALNLNNPTLKYYGDNKDQPRAFYTSGRQYYLTLRAEL
jgi:iron complex outermembrane receptor protein